MRLPAPHIAVEDTLPVSEVFGPTLQGEGPAAGQAAWFLRFMGCNLSCSWCDSAYTWDAARYDLRQETTHRSAAELAAQIVGPGLVVLTGGEPLLQQHRPAFAALLDMLADRDTHIETNGTIAPSLALAARVDVFVVSPKLGNAGPHRGRQNPALHPAWAQVPHAHLKMVCETARDVHTAAELAHAAGFPPHRTWVMPEGTSAAVLGARWPGIAAAAADHGINASHRLHVLAWGDERGH